MKGDVEKAKKNIYAKNKGESTTLKMTNLEITELRERFSAIIKPAVVGFCLTVRYLVSADIAPLGESLPTDFTLEGLFTGVPSLVGLGRIRLVPCNIP